MKNIANLIDTIYLSENSRSFSIIDVKVKGSSLIEKSKNKYKVLQFLKSVKELKVRGKENQFEQFKKLEEFGIKLVFPVRYNRDFLLSKLFGFICLR